MPIKQRPNPPMYSGGMGIGAEEEAAVLEVLRNKRLFRYYGPDEGPSKVEQLEAEFSPHMGTRRALAVASGTAALMCGLRGLGIGSGDEVIVPAYTWIASAAAILAVGAVPVVAEIDQITHPQPGGCGSENHSIHKGDHAGAYARNAVPDGRDHGCRPGGTG